MDGEGTIQIRSYRICFDLERRLHKVDRWRIPLPYGVPLRGLAYSAVAFVAVLVLSQLPITAALLGVLHPALRFVVMPVALAVALTRWTLDSRPAHRVAASLLRLHTEPTRIAGFRPALLRGPGGPATVRVAHDDRSTVVRRAAVAGPARVTLRYPVETRARGRALVVRQTGQEPLWRGKQIDLRAGQRLVVR